MLEAGNAKARARASRNLMRSRKLNFYLLEKAGRCSGGRGAQPPDPDLENNDACWREAARQQASLFSQGVSKGAQPLPPEAFFLFA